MTKIELSSMSAINHFVSVATKHGSEVKLYNHDRSYCINGKSLLGVIATTEWDDLYVVCEDGLYGDFVEFFSEKA
jgi:hypothetical protein